MEAQVYSQNGDEVGKVKLPERIFNLPWNSNLVHDVIYSMMSNKRKGTAHVKDRGEVSGGGKKPWRQKGTGRARHGSIRSPIWVGGGVSHGPNKDKNYSKKINKKAKTKALHTILSKKLREGEILFLDRLQISEPKTKLAKEIIMSLGKIDGFEKIKSKKKNSALFALESKNNSLYKGFRNFSNVEVSEVRNINPSLVLQYKFLIISNPETALKNIPGRI
jgi:large subunit ribosomal protein L4